MWWLVVWCLWYGTLAVKMQLDGNGLIRAKCEIDSEDDAKKSQFHKITNQFAKHLSNFDFYSIFEDPSKKKKNLHQYRPLHPFLFLLFSLSLANKRWTKTNDLKSGCYKLIVVHFSYFAHFRLPASNIHWLSMERAESAYCQAPAFRPTQIIYGISKANCV